MSFLSLVTPSWSLFYLINKATPVLSFPFAPSWYEEACTDVTLRKHRESKLAMPEEYFNTLGSVLTESVHTGFSIFAEVVNPKLHFPLV